jgi:hypothetical protein
MKEVRETFADSLAALERAQEFWASKGHNLSATRIGNYMRRLKHVIAIGKSGRQSLNEDKRAQDTLMLSEILEFRYVFERVATQPHLAGSSRVPKIFAGPDLAFHETSSALQYPRNTMLELLVAVAIEDAGLKVDLSGETDVATVFDGVDVAIECKRPQNDKKAEAAIRAACKQLARRSSENGLRLVLVGIGKMLSEGSKWFIVENREELDERLAAATGWFHQETLRHWQNRDISGLMVYLNVPALVKSEGLVCHTTTLHTYARPSLPPAQRILLDRFDALIHDGFPNRVSGASDGR